MPAVPDAARTAVVDRRQLTGKMKSTALEKNTTGSASPRRTIVPMLATASSVILVLKETEAAKADGRYTGQTISLIMRKRLIAISNSATISSEELIAELHNVWSYENTSMRRANSDY